MKMQYTYDEEVDAISVNIRAEKSDMTIQLGQHIRIDITNDWKHVGVEIRNASDEISKIFGRVITKNEIRELLCSIRKKPSNEYVIRFKLPQKNESASYVIPLCHRPILSHA